jgi:hypothetical protein
VRSGVEWSGGHLCTLWANEASLGIMALCSALSSSGILSSSPSPTRTEKPTQTAAVSRPIAAGRIERGKGIIQLVNRGSLGLSTVSSRNSNGSRFAGSIWRRDGKLGSLRAVGDDAEAASMQKEVR